LGNSIVVLMAVLGCADLDSVPDGATVTRRGNTTVVRCVTSSVTWTLICDGTRWTGHSQQCPSTGLSLRFICYLFKLTKHNANCQLPIPLALTFTGITVKQQIKW